MRGRNSALRRYPECVYQDIYADIYQDMVVTIQRPDLLEEQRMFLGALL